MVPQLLEQRLVTFDTGAESDEGGDGLTGDLVRRPTTAASATDRCDTRADSTSVVEML